MNSDGSFDSSFGNNGIALIDFYSGSERLADMQLMKDGKLLLFSGGCGFGQAIIKLNSSGTLDSSFGNNGILSLSYDAMYALVQPDNKIIMIGEIDEDFRIFRLLEDGSIDSSFGNAGFVQTDISGGDPSQLGILQPDGKIVVVGTWFTVARYLNDLNVGITSPSNPAINFAISPNPAKTSISFTTINYARPFTLRVTDLLGNIVLEKTYSSTLESSEQININDFSSGTYVVSVLTEDGSVSRLLVKQ